jgi:hypothetical protein
MSELAPLAAKLSLGSVLETLGTYELVDHWTQGEFHHDVVVRAGERILVVATNCNGGVKEILAFDEVPERWALWRWRCRDNPDFEGELPAIRDRITTVHYFDPCALLADDARSELRLEHRVRQRGGGWIRKGS